MVVKTKGIILHQIKYSDSGIVIQAYTRELGRLSFLVKGMRRRKSGKHNAFFQPMFILDLIFYYKESRSMQLLKEFSVSYLPADIYAEVKKTSIAIFLGEILTSVLKEESPHYKLYDFIEDSVKYLDKSRTGYSNFHIAFLVSLSSYMGFEPGVSSDDKNKYFDLRNGIFVPTFPAHNDFAEADVSASLARFLKATYDHSGSIPITGRQRNELLETIIRYYSIHLPGLKKINSLEILKEIFN